MAEAMLRARALSTKNLKVVLVLLRQPPAPWERPGQPRDSEDLGIAYLSAALEAAGQPHLILDQGLTTLDDDTFCDLITALKPQVVGYSDNSDCLDRIIRIARGVRNRIPGVYQVIGDHVASFHAEDLVTGDTGFDAVCVGEGEATLVELLERLRAGEAPAKTAGLFTRSGGKAQFWPRANIKEPSTLPWPKRYVLSSLTTEERRSASCAIIASRGCPYRCSYCGNDLWQQFNPGRPWRPRDPVELADEMEHVLKTYGVHDFLFLDELFVGPPTGESRSRLLRFCDEIRRRDLKVSFRITCRVDFFNLPDDLEVLLALREAGLDKFFFGVENGYPATLTLYNKGRGITAEDMERTIRCIRDNGVFVFISFILFHPFITREELDFNLDFIHRIGNSHLWGTYASRLRVNPDMSIFRRVENSGLLLSRSRWGEHAYAFADRRMQGIYERFHRTGRLFSEVDRSMEELMHHLFYLGPEGRKLHDSIGEGVGRKYVSLSRRLAAGEVPVTDLLTVKGEVQSLMQSASAWSTDGGPPMGEATV